jgi:triacylglycerol lipase
MRPPVRPLPPPTWEVVFPPNDLHAFFQDVAHHPFSADAEAFAPVNAWWLSELSLLAYSSAGAAGAAWAAAGLKDAGWQLEVIENDSTRALVASRAGAALVAFRGTLVLRPGPGWEDALRNLETDANLLLEPWAGQGRVHRGFARALEEVWDPLAARLDALAAGGRRVFFTGHSLGAALATLAAARWRARRAPEAAAVYTFGSPRVGDGAFAASLALPAFRVVNNNDVVAHVPLPAPYKHAGQLRLFDASGRGVAEPDVWLRLREAAAGRLLRTREWLRSAAQGALLVPGDPLVCHAPLYYALLSWNEYALRHNE